MEKNYTKDEILEIETILRDKIKNTGYSFQDLKITYEDEFFFKEDNKKAKPAYKIYLKLQKNGKIIDFSPNVFVNRVDVFQVAHHILFDLYSICSQEDRNDIYQLL